jgi:hypothetical protein
MLYPHSFFDYFYVLCITDDIDLRIIQVMVSSARFRTNQISYSILKVKFNRKYLYNDR